MTDQPAPRPHRIRRARTRLRAGRFMQGVALVGLVTVVIATVVGWRLVGQLTDTVDESLVVTGETLTTLKDTIELAEDLIESVDAALGATGAALDQVVDSFGETEAVVGQLDVLVGVVADNVDAVATTLRELAAVGRTIDGALGALSNLPFGPSYEPERPFGDQLAVLADELEPIVAALQTTQAGLEEFVGDTGALAGELDRLAQAVADINTDLARSRLLFASYLATAERAERLTLDARADLSGDATLARLLLLIGGLTIAAGQIVPYWVGKELTISALEDPELGRRPGPGHGV